MFQRLLKVSAVSIIICGILVAIVPALSARMPDRSPWPDAGFRACELPCWSNITPGQTPFAQVVPLLNGTLPSDARLLISGSQVDFWTQIDDSPFYGYLYYTQGSVGNMSMHVELTVGQIMRRLGQPGCVYMEQVDTGDRLMAVYWETTVGMVGVLVPIHNNRWGPNNRTQTLFLGGPQPACNREKAAHWRGFAPYTRYIDWLSASD